MLIIKDAVGFYWTGHHWGPRLEAAEYRWLSELPDSLDDGERYLELYTHGRDGANYYREGGVVPVATPIKVSSKINQTRTKTLSTALDSAFIKED